jgi:GNAT superfamily N-acetyltransferase
MNINIREAREEDIEAILEIYSQPSIDNGICLNHKEAKEIFRIIETYPNYKIYVAEIENRIVGTIAVLIMHNIGHLGKKSAIFESIAVLPEWQGQGIGKRMLENSIEICKEIGCYKITLSANIKRDKAHQFYESLGLVQHGISFKYTFEN